LHYEGSFEVAASPEKAYAFLVDPRQLLSVIPDVESSDVVDDSNFSARAKVGMSFIKGSVALKFTFVEKKPNSYAKLSAKGSGAGSSMDILMTFNVNETQSGGSQVLWSTDAKVGGLMASVGSRLIDSAAEKYITRVIDSLKQKLGS
jgi:carbon monoxide dehydrogenase subunit G